MEKSTKSNKKKIIWARYVLLDAHLHKTTEIGILGQLAESGYEIYFLSAYSRERYKFLNPEIHTCSIHIGNRHFISYLIFTLMQVIYFPVLLMKAKPIFVIVDENSLLGLIPSLAFFRLIGAKIVFDVRSTPTPIENLNERVTVSQRMAALSFNVSVMIAKKVLDGITVLTDLMKKEICGRFDIDPNRVGVWTSGVSGKLYRPERYVSDAARLKRELGFSDRFLVSYHGSFSQSRGLVEVIEALGIIKDKYPLVSLFVLGSGPDQTLTEMQDTIKRLELERRVIIHGPVSYTQVPEFIAMCDVGIIPLPNLPQWRNQCPLKLLEYLAMEKPVILTDIPCHRVVVGTSECGIYIPSTQPSEIAKAIAFAFENRENLKKRGTKGREIIEESYTWERIEENLECYLKRL
jgi:glycosyltransferase involved in cell wall biosynthesis